MISGIIITLVHVIVEYELNNYYKTKRIIKSEPFYKNKKLLMVKSILNQIQLVNVPIDSIKIMIIIPSITTKLRTKIIDVLYPSIDIDTNSSKEKTQ